MQSLSRKLSKFFSLHIKPIHNQLLLGRWSILETPPYIYKYMDNDSVYVSNTNHTKTYTLDTERLVEINKRQYKTSK